MDYKIHRQHRRYVLNYPGYESRLYGMTQELIKARTRQGKMARQLYRLSESYYDRALPF